MGKSDNKFKTDVAHRLLSSRIMNLIWEFEKEHSLTVNAYMMLRGKEKTQCTSTIKLGKKGKKDGKKEKN